MERKVVQYIKCAEGDIQAAIVLDAQYPKANRAKVALRVADGSAAGAWVRYFDTIYDEKLVEQPPKLVSSPCQLRSRPPRSPAAPTRSHATAV